MTIDHLIKFLKRLDPYIYVQRPGKLLYRKEFDPPIIIKDGQKLEITYAVCLSGEDNE